MESYELNLQMLSAATKCWVTYVMYFCCSQKKGVQRHVKVIFEMCTIHVIAL